MSNKRLYGQSSPELSASRKLDLGLTTKMNTGVIKKGGPGSGVYERDKDSKDVGQPRAYLNESHRGTVDDFAKHGWSEDTNTNNVSALAEEVAKPSQARNMPEGLVRQAKEMLAAFSTESDLDDDEAMGLAKEFMTKASAAFSRAKNPSVS